MRSPGRVIIGFGLVGLGIVYLLDAAEWVDAGDVISRWWPLIVIAVGVAQWLANRSAWFGPTLLIGLGLVFLGQRNDILGDNVWTFVWPFVLIGIGAWILWGRGGAPSTTGGGTVGVISILTGQDAVVSGEPFRGGDATVILGGATIDLSEATLEGDVTITATVLLGGLDILVPEGWKITITGTPFLGGWDNTTRRDLVPSDAPRLNVRALVILGGLEVQHPERWG
jgi:hypothetical protein